MKSIIIIIDYFGQWPEWFDIYLESCRRNPTINWLIHTDCPFDSYHIENVKFKYVSLPDYAKHVSETLGIKFEPYNTYKFCDLRPMFGVLYEEEIKNYDFYGYGDIDLIYGDIRKFYTDEVLENTVISTHEWCISGHLALFKNEDWVRNAFRRLNNWKEFLEKPTGTRFCEDTYIKVFSYPRFLPRVLRSVYDLLHPFSKKYRKKIYLKEQWTTPLTPSQWTTGQWEHPTVWYWKDGRITNELSDQEESIYFHFMNFKYARYMSPIYGKDAFWHGLPKIVHVKPEEIPHGVRIDRYGFHPLSSPETGSDI